MNNALPHYFIQRERKAKRTVSEKSCKLKITKPTERQEFKQAFLSLSQFSWAEKQEQYCDYRLDGTPAGSGKGQWFRIKQYTNGTLYIEASDPQLYSQTLQQLPSLASQVGLTSAPQQQTLSGMPARTSTTKSSTKTSGLLDIQGAYIGTDESGKGDYFGPLVIAGVFVTEETIPQLIQLGVMDSKKLNDSTIGKLTAEITRVVGTHAICCIEIGPKRYNELYNKFKSGGRNLNHLLAWGHATAIENLLTEHPECTQAVADQFGNERYILSQMKEKGKQIKLYQTHRAEANVGVAAASIIARNRYVQKMDRLSNQFGLELPKGASAKVKSQARKYVSQYGSGRLEEVAKLHFKTTAEIT